MKAQEFRKLVIEVLSCCRNLPMDRRLFEESVLCANLPATVLDEIEKVDPEIPTELLDSIFNSDMESFLNSVRLPDVEKTEKSSRLLRDVKSIVEKIQQPKVEELCTGHSTSADLE